jgi:hypothetical protein
MPDANGSANGSLVHAADPPALPLVPRVISTVLRAADDQLSESRRHLAIHLQVTLDILPHGGRDIRPATQSLLVDLGVPACRGVAVPHVVQVDLRESRRLGELVEAARDRIRMGRPAVLPAEQQAVIVVAGSELRTLAVQHLDMPGEHGEGERVQRDHTLRILVLPSDSTTLPSTTTLVSSIARVPAPRSSGRSGLRPVRAWSGSPKSHLPSWPFQVPDEADHESVVRLYLEPVKPSPVRSDRVLLEPG